MKRFLIVFLCFVLCFSFPLSVLALDGDTNGDGVIDYRDWTLSEKLSYFTDHAADTLWEMIRLNPNWKTQGYELVNAKVATYGYASYADFMVKNTTYHGANEVPSNPEPHFELSPEGITIINEIKTEIEDSLEYIDLYALPASYIPYESFARAEMGQFFRDVINVNPDMVFYICDMNTWYGENWFLIGIDCDDVAGLYSSEESSWLNPVSLYDYSSWNCLSDGGLTNFYAIGFSSVDGWVQAHYMGTDGSHQTDAFLMASDYTDMPSKIRGGMWWRGYDGYFMDESIDCPNRTFLLYNSKNPTSSLTGGALIDTSRSNPHTLFSSNQGSIPCFKSLLALKAGTADKLGFTPADGFSPGTPITNNVVPIITVNNNGNDGDSNGDNTPTVVDPTGPYPKPGTGDNVVPNPNDPSGGNEDGDEDPISTDGGILKAIKKLVNLIFSPLSSALNHISTEISKITTSVSNLLTNVTGLFTTNGFIKVMNAFFPFIPSEWKTLVSMALGLPLLGVLARFLYGLFK